MKRKILNIGILLISLTSFAQKEALTGKWIEQRRSLVDTLDLGRDLVNAEYDAYRSGQKKLDAKYIYVKEFIAPDSNKLKLEIWHENEFLYAAVAGDLKNKFILEPKQGKYFLKYIGTIYEIIYDSKNNMLRLVNLEHKLEFYEFKT